MTKDSTSTTQKILRLFIGGISLERILLLITLGGMIYNLIITHVKRTEMIKSHDASLNQLTVTTDSLKRQYEFLEHDFKTIQAKTDSMTKRHWRLEKRVGQLEASR